MAVTTFGVTSTSILDRLPQIDVSSTAPVTPPVIPRPLCPAPSL